MNANPLVSILVPVYNAEPFLPSLLRSVSEQQYENWEIIFVDDGSTDQSVALLTSASAADDRIRLILNEGNLGPSTTLNRAAAAARGDLLARLDADDTMLPERLGKQVAFLEDRREVGLLGSFYRNVNPDGKRGKVESTPLIVGDKLRAAFLFFNPMGHSTVIYRREAFNRVGGYDESLRASLDYDLLARLSRVTPGAILPRVLVNYRTHRHNITTSKSSLQLENAKLVQQNLFAHYGFTATATQLETHYRIQLYRGLPAGATDGPLLREARAWLKELARQNSVLNVFDVEEFAITLREVHTSLYARRASTLALSDYLSNFTTEFGSLRPRQLVRQLAHSLKNGL